MSSNPGRSRERIFFSGVNFECWLLFGVCSTPVLPQWHVKDPGHAAKSAGGRLHATCIYPWPNKVGVGWLCRCQGIEWELSGNELTHNLSGNIRPQSSLLVQQLWTDPGVHNLISTLKKKKKEKKKKRRQGINGRTFSQNPRKRGKSHHQEQGPSATLLGIPWNSVNLSQEKKKRRKRLGGIRSNLTVTNVVSLWSHPNPLHAISH